MDPRQALDMAVAQLHVALALGGVVVCALHVGRSRWVVPLLAGFLVDMAVPLGYRAATWMLGNNVASFQKMGLAFTVLSVLGLLGRAALVLGLAGLLRERPPGSRPA